MSLKTLGSYISFVGANDTKIQNIIGKDVEPHSCWYRMKSISFHWFINFGFWPFLVELILLIFECRFETFNICCPLFFPRHFKHEIKNQTRQPNPNFNCLSHSKTPQILYQIVTQHHKSHPLSVVPLSLIHLQPMQPPSKATTTTNHPTIHNQCKVVQSD